VNEHLMRALLYAGLFFATCTEEQCDLDTAVKQLEGLTAELNRLSAAAKAEFQAFMFREAAAHPRARCRRGNLAVRHCNIQRGRLRSRQRGK
jgi:hypothetical protein